jgi:threonine/homoserine/homoserine lactone efflux protein
MTHVDHLWLFFALVFGVVILPGLDMAYILASTLVGGRKAGWVAIAGVMSGGCVHVLIASLGVGSILKYSPGAFNLLLIAGSLYMAWVGISLARMKSTSQHDVAIVRPTMRKTFVRGALTNLANPKAYMFMLAVFPQFIRTEYGPIWTQVLALWGLIAIAQAAGYGIITLFAGGAHTLLSSRPALVLAVHRTVGVVLMVAALATGIEGWRMM